MANSRVVKFFSLPAIINHKRYNGVNTKLWIVQIIKPSYVTHVPTNPSQQLKTLERGMYERAIICH